MFPEHSVHFHFFRLRVLLCLSLCVVTFPVSRSARESSEDRFRQIIRQMTVSEKVGQLFLITIYSTTLDSGDRDLISATHPGGIVLFPANVNSPEQVAQLVNALQQQSTTSSPGLPLFIATDQEGGQVSRLRDGFTVFPSPMLLGATASYEDAVEQGKAMGVEMQAVGINMNLAPVVDLQSPEQDRDTLQVLYHRTMSSNPELVGMLASGLVQGMRAEGVIGVLKHFPGHGLVTQDSHLELPQVNLSREEAEQTALAPFRIAIEADAPAVMIGHLYYPSLDPGIRRPATFSPVVMGVLRDELGFDGVIITDALDMGAVSEQYTLSDAAVAAINAGVDLVTFGPHVSAWDQQVAISAVIETVKDGRISSERIDQALLRIMNLRDQYGLLTWTPLEIERTREHLDLDSHRGVLFRLGLDAITILEDWQTLLPLDPGTKVTLVYPLDYPKIFNECSKYDPDLSPVGYSYWPSNWEISTAIQSAAQADVVVVFEEDIAQNGARYNLVWALPPEKTVVVAMHSPYDWDYLPTSLSTVVLTYDSTPIMHTASCQVLYGIAPAKGHIPVKIGGYTVGTGIMLSASDASHTQ